MSMIVRNLEELPKEPFRKYNVEEDFTKNEIFSVRLNKEERALIDHIKAVIDLKSDSTALKFAAKRGWNVLLRTFGEDELRYLIKKERHRLSNYK